MDTFCWQINNALLNDPCWKGYGQTMQLMYENNLQRRKTSYYITVNILNIRNNLYKRPLTVSYFFIITISNDPWNYILIELFFSLIFNSLHYSQLNSGKGNKPGSLLKLFRACMNWKKVPLVCGKQKKLS